MISSSHVIALMAISSLCLAGEKSLFNGKDLTGWKGEPEFWSVKDGAITGHSTVDTSPKENTFLILEGVEVADFELHFKYKITDSKGGSAGFGNSGVQYRSKIVKPEYSVVAGYQADIECGSNYSGIIYEEKGRGILAQRGQKVIVKDGVEPGKPLIEVVGEVGKSDEIQAIINPAGWNNYVVIAKGGHLKHFINGKPSAELLDESTAAAKTGIIALQLHAGGPMTVQFKDIVLKTDD